MCLLRKIYHWVHPFNQYIQYAHGPYLSTRSNQLTLEFLNAANYCGIVTLKHIDEAKFIETINVENAAELILTVQQYILSCIKRESI